MSWADKALRKNRLEVAAKDGDPAVVVISDYSPTDNYFLCGGKKWRMG